MDTPIHNLGSSSERSEVASDREGSVSVDERASSPVTDATIKMVERQAGLNRYSKSHPSGQGVPAHLRLKDCYRVCIFNTKGTTVRDAWEELRYILDATMYAAIVKLQRVTHRSNKPRIDMWVRPEVSASL